MSISTRIPSHSKSISAGPAEYQPTDSVLEGMKSEAGLQVTASDTEHHSMMTVSLSQQRQVQDMPGNIRRARFCQDGHTPQEENMYQYMWKKGSLTANGNTRRISIGYQAIANGVNCSDKTAKRTLLRLQEKLSITLVAPEICGKKVGRTYDVFSYGEILKRRRRAGFTHVARKGRTRFVTCPESLALLEAESKNNGEMPASNLTKVQQAMDELTTVSPHKPSMVTMDKLTTPLRKVLGIKASKTTTLEEVAQVEAALSRHVSPDAKAARLLIQRIRASGDNASIEKIVDTIDSKAPALVRNFSIRSPLAFLITRMPEYLREADLLQRSRQTHFGKQRNDGTEKAQAAQQQEIARWATEELSNGCVAGPKGDRVRKAAEIIKKASLKAMDNICSGPTEHRSLEIKGTG